MLQLSRARNRLTTPATLTLPEIASSGLTVSMWWSRSLYRSGSITTVWILGCILLKVGFWSISWGRTASANLSGFGCSSCGYLPVGMQRTWAWELWFSENKFCYLPKNLVQGWYDMPLWTLLHPLLSLSCTYHLIKGSESSDRYLQLLSLCFSPNVLFLPWGNCSVAWEKRMIFQH